MVYERFIATAERLLKRYGGPTKFIPNNAKLATDTSKPWRRKVTPPSVNDFLTAAFLPLESVVRPGSTLTSGAQAGSQAVLIAAAELAISPKAGDTLQRKGSDILWKVDATDTINVNGDEPIIHILRVFV